MGQGTADRTDHPLTVSHGVVAGLLGGTAVAVFFFLVDLAQGDPFRTPAFLAEIVLGGAAVPGDVLMIALFTVLHLLVFAGIGAGAVLLFRWAELPQNLLLGAVYGLCVSSLIFYASLIVTGAGVLPAPWWSAVLVGNLLAGLVMGGYLHWVGPRPGVSGIMHELGAHPTLREGLVAGLLGAVAVAAWFFVVDVVVREPFFTPAALGSAILAGARAPGQVAFDASTIVGYTVLHVAAFLLVGIVAAGLVAQVEKFPPLVFGLVILFVVFEVFFVGMTAMLGSWILEELAWWSVLVGNLMAAVCMGTYLWRAHPVLQQELRDGAMWAES